MVDGSVSYEISGKSMGNLWEINGNQRYQPSKMEHAQRSAFGRPEPWIALKLHQDK
jgi:hypothetical protein